MTAAAHSSKQRPDKAALADAVLRAFASLVIFAFGWWYPDFFLSRDLTMRSDPDPRTGPAVLLALVAALIWGVLALKSLFRAFTPQPTQSR